MVRKWGVAANLLVVLFFLTTNVWAQQSRETFGKSRVQYKVFDWRYFSTENFDIYFYKGGDKVAKDAAKYLEDEFERLTDIIGYSPYSKTKVFLYNSISDLQQSNIGINDATFSVGGQTDFIKSHVEIAHTGTIVGLKEELLLNVTRLLINDMMFGGSLTDMFQSAYLLNLPEWFIEGAAYYLAQGWSMEMDDYVRELVRSKKIKKVTKFSGEDAVLAGQSIWNFIAERYGMNSISNILNLTRIIRNEEKSISNTLGTDFKKVLLEWQAFYTTQAGHLQGTYIKPEDNLKIHAKNKKDLVFSSVRLAPHGRQVAYAENDNGRYTVKIHNFETKAETAILSGGYRVINQQVDKDVPLVDWIDENTLGIINYHKGSVTFWAYDLLTHSKIPTQLARLDQVKSMDFSGNGRLGILSADVNGQNDLYLLSVRRGRLRRLTNDQFDDNYAAFVPNTNTIAFSSNRITDSLTVKATEFDKLTDNFNLFFYSLDTTKQVLARITNTISKDVRPIPQSAYEIFYLSDQKGIQNVFKYSIVDSLYTQVSNYAYSLKDFDINFETGKMAYIMPDFDEEYLYLDPSPNLQRTIFTPQSKRQETIQAKFMAERRRQKQLEQKSEDPVVVDFREKEPVVDEDTDLIDTDNYVFDKEVDDDSGEQTESFLTRYRRLQTNKDIIGPLPYETRFSADNLVTSWVVDPFRGFGILVETEMNDLLEDHRFYGGIMAATDFRSGDVFAEYNYLKTPIDFGAKFLRSVIKQDVDAEGTLVSQQYNKNILEVSAAMPLNAKSKVAVKPFIALTKFENLDPNLVGQALTSASAPLRRNNNYIGAKVEYVFDNSIIRGMNLIEGTRGKASFSHYEGITDKERSFSRLSLDLRHYQKIHRDLIFATRAYYGKSFGRMPAKFMLGGMDNWLFNRTEQGGTNNPLRDEFSKDNVENPDIFFAEFVTSLRGFNYNTFFGTDVLLFNAEIRFPIIKYFYRGPISSNFFRNLQFVGFYDIGSAWTGPSPFSSDNEVNTEIIERPNSVFRAEIQNFSSPWLQSYGVGMRTVILGFYMKFDLAWPIEDYRVQSPRLFATLGFDF